MRRTKISAFIALTAVSAFLLVSSFTPAAGGQRLEIGHPVPGPITANFIGSVPGPITASFIGIGGMVFQPGQNIEIKWILQGAGVKYFETHPWAECELFFSADGTKTWARITPELDIITRIYEWTVPNVLTREGVIALQIGIVNAGEYYLFPSQPFAVLPGKLH